MAEHCRAEYETVPNFILWMLAELAVIACDIPEGISSLSFRSLLLYHSDQLQFKVEFQTCTVPVNSKLKWRSSKEIKLSQCNFLIKFATLESQLFSNLPFQ